MFVDNYLSIWREFKLKGYVSTYYFEKEKYILLRHFLLGFIVKLLFYKDLGNFEIKGAWKSMLKSIGIILIFIVLFLYYILNTIFNLSDNCIGKVSI